MLCCVSVAPAYAFAKRLGTTGNDRTTVSGLSESLYDHSLSVQVLLSYLLRCRRGDTLHNRLQSKLPVVPHATGRKLSLYDSRSKPLVPKINRQSSFNERAHAEQNSSGTSWWYSYCHVLVDTCFILQDQ